MKNTYIIAIKENLEPYFIQKRVWEDISYIWRDFYRAYIFETKTKAMEVWKDWYNTRLQKQEDLPKF